MKLIICSEKLHFGMIKGQGSTDFDMEKERPINQNSSTTSFYAHSPKVVRRKSSGNNYLLKNERTGSLNWFWSTIIKSWFAIGRTNHFQNIFHFFISLKGFQLFTSPIRPSDVLGAQTRIVRQDRGGSRDRNQSWGKAWLFQNNARTEVRLHMMKWRL